MKQTAKILEFQGKELKTVEQVRAALIAILEDIESGDATVTEAEPLRKEIKELMRKIRAQVKRATPEDVAAVKSFFGE